MRIFLGTMPRAMNWEEIACRQRPACIIAKEFTMRNRILAIAAIAGAISTPIAAQAQTEITTGVVRGGSVIVGGVLPEAGITYYDVPQTYGPTPYRYTVVNGRTVLVEPRSRRIVQVVE